jgi:hypothetical protein
MQAARSFTMIEFPTVGEFPTVASEENDIELRELVRRHGVIWETHPELALCDGALAPIGFDVELSATGDHPAHPLSAGCPECAPVEAALRRIALAVLPRGEHASWYDVHVSDAVQIDPAHGSRAELSATIAILHIGTVNRPTDECERACLALVRARLVALGAQQGCWVEPRASEIAPAGDTGGGAPSSA